MVAFKNTVTNGSNMLVGMETATASLSSYPGNSGTDSIGIQANNLSGGRWYYGGSSNSPTYSFSTAEGELCWQVIDLKTGKVWWCTGTGTHWVNGGSPDAGTGGELAAGFTDGVLVYPVVGIYGGTPQKVTLITDPALIPDPPASGFSTVTKGWPA